MRTGAAATSLEASAAPASPASRRRAVVLVGNPAAPYSRGLRIARVLAEAGYDVEIAAVAVPGLPDHERDGAVEIRRYRPSGPLRRLAARHVGVVGTAARSGGDPGDVPTVDGTGSPGASPGIARAGRQAGRSRRSSLARTAIDVAVARSRAVAMVFPRWFLWPHTVRAWWHALDREMPPADLYHACGSLALSPALSARERDRRAGRRAIVVYDVIDDVLAGNNALGMPGLVRRMLARREATWARRADGLTTVNEGLAHRIDARWHPTRPSLVVPNYPQGRPQDRTRDMIRRATGLGDGTRIVLFQGRLGPNLGLDEAADAVLRVPDAALVLIGFGRSLEQCRARDADPRFAGRHFTLPAVHPDELTTWTAGADVCLVPLPPVSLNQRLSTPNKFWEALAAGTPVVIGPGLALMEQLVRDHDLGIVARSLSPADLAAAIREVLDRPADERAAQRARIAALADARFSWSSVAAEYATFVHALAGTSQTG